MAIKIDQEIKALPAVPAEGEGYRARAATWMAALVTFATQLVTWTTQANALAESVTAEAATCSEAATAIADTVDAAAASATAAQESAALAEGAKTVAAEKAGLAVAAAGLADEAKTVAVDARNVAVAAAETALGGGIAKPAGVGPGDLLTWDAAGNPIRIPAGTPGQSLQVMENNIPGFGGTTAQAAEVTRITDALFSVWSNGTIESAYSSVDLLGGTGQFETDADVAAWTSRLSSALSRDTALKRDGNSSLKIVGSGTSTGGAYRAFPVVAGRVYKVVAYVYIGTQTSANLHIGTSESANDISWLWIQTSGSWQKMELVFEATTTTNYYITLLSSHSVASGINNWDSITIYDMGANLVTNGTFNSNTTGWTSYGAGSITSAAGGINGNCAQVTVVPSGYSYCPVSGLTVGKLYRLCGWLKNGAGTGPVMSFSHTGPGIIVEDVACNRSCTSLAGWTFYSGIFEAFSTSGYVNLSGASANSFLFDSITLTEVTVGCVGYDTKACDLWNKDLAVACFHETTRVKSGSAHAMRVYNGKVYWSDGQRSAKPEFYNQFADVGAVVKGLWVLSSVAGKARVGILDSVGESWSTYHPGDGEYHYLQVTRTPAAGITSFQTVVDSGTGSEAIFSQAQFQPGNVLPEGAFVPRPGEYIPFESTKQSLAFKGSSRVSSSATTINPRSDSSGAVPHGAKRLQLQAWAKDSASAGNGCRFKLGGSPYAEVIADATGRTNETFTGTSGIATLVSGLLPVAIEASGSSTLLPDLYYQGVQL